MARKTARPNDCDLVALNKDHNSFTGTAHLASISIQTRLLPQPLTFPKKSIAYIHFKGPHQVEDYIQLVSGGSAAGEIVRLDALEFTIAESGQRVSLPRNTLLAVIFRCSIEKAVGRRARPRT